MKNIYMQENDNFLKEQLITYLGNKRKLLPFIGHEIEKIDNFLNSKNKLNIFDGFSGSGVCSRYFK